MTSVLLKRFRVFDLYRRIELIYKDNRKYLEHEKYF